MIKKIILLGLIALITMVYAQETEYYEGELIIQLRGDYRNTEQSEQDLSRLVSDFQEYDLQLERRLSNRLRIWLISFNTERSDTQSFLSIIKSHPVIEVAQFNHKVSLRQTIPNDPMFDQQWALLNTGQGGGIPGADIDATLAWDITTGGETENGREIVIAVIDDGFALNHPDIDFWKNQNEIPGNGIDNDGNGYIDDYDGWNAYNNSGNIPVASHGTHVAGIAAATGNNGTGVTGVNWGAKIMPIAGASSNEAIVVAAYGYVHEMRSLYNETNGSLGAYIVATNSSFGVNYGQPHNYPLWGAMYDAMGEVGILSAAATMNINANVDVTGDVPTAFPSPYLLGVTNTTRTDQKNTGAAYGATTIDLGAPGTQILSTTPNNNYSNMTGTSMASPHVAGAIALMYAAAPAALLNLYEDEPGELALIMKDLLLQGVDVIPSLENITVSGGRLNLNNALQLLLDYEYDLPVPAPYNLTAEYINNAVLLNWEVDDDRTPQYFYVFRNNLQIGYLESGSNSFTDTSIENGWTYEYFVLAGYMNPDGLSDPSNVVGLTIPPSAPSLVFPQNGAVDLPLDLTLQWDTVYGAESYLLEVAYDEMFQDMFIDQVVTEEPFYQLPLLDFEVMYYWHVASVNEGGTSGWSETFVYTTEKEKSAEDPSISVTTEIRKVYPNPYSFRSSSRYNGISIDLGIQEPLFTIVSVYNVRGQKVKELLSDDLSSGRHTIHWDGRDRSGREVSSGIYFIRMDNQGTSDISKLLLLK